MGLNPDQWYSIIRQLLLAAGAIAVFKGWVSSDTLTQIIGVIMTVVSSGLSLVFHSTAGQSIVAPASGAATPTGPPKS